jgi:hypothetical protein
MIPGSGGGTTTGTGGTATTTTTSSSTGGTGGTGTTSTTSSTGGAGGTTTTTTTTSSTGGGMPCTSPADCPGSDTDCATRTCTMGMCGVSFTAQGTATTTQTPGDCHKNECDGMGNVTMAVDDTDVPVDNKQCTRDVCTGGTPSNPPESAGTACTDNGGKVCDGSGNCVACVVGSDCATGVCMQNMCVAATCADGVKNGMETDVDCGGPTCSACPTGLSCMVDGDCQSSACDADTLTCVANQCADHQKDGGETDIDCGGPACPACADGKGCMIGADCADLVCSGTSHTCSAPTCSDGVKNGTETDVDCGGSCSGCGPGSACSVDADCKGGLCTGGTCQPTCTDGVKNGSETDVDCGGSCSACGNGLHCGVAADCQSGVCTGGVCQAPTCSDGVQNGNETSIDCGGSCGTCTVLVLGAGASSTVGGEFHPESGWVTSTTLGGKSVSGLALTFLPGNGSAVGLMRFTSIGDPSDQAVQSTTWTPGAWSAFANVGAGITTAGAPTVGALGAGALGAFRGTDDNYYYVTFSGGAWSGALPVQPSGGGQSSGPQGPSFDGTTSTLAFGGDNQHIFVQSFSGGAWGAAQDLDGTNLTAVSPTIAGMAPFGSAAVIVYYASGKVFYQALSGGSWSGPQYLIGVNVNGPIALAPARSGGVVWALRDEFGFLYTGGILPDGTVVGKLFSSTLTIKSAPALARGVGAATAEMVFVEADGVAYHTRLIGDMFTGMWTSPVAVGGSSLSNVAIASAP